MQIRKILTRFIIPQKGWYAMRNIENLFKNIRPSQECVIEEIVKTIEPYIENQLSINDMAEGLGIRREDTANAFKALGIAEVIVFTAQRGKKTSVVVTDVKTFNLIRKRFGLPTFEEEGA